MKIRSEILALNGYSSARKEFKGQQNIMLNANESPFGDGISNRYPDPFQEELANKLSEIKNINPLNITLGNGSDELIDLIIRVFLTPFKSKALVIDPSFSMYEYLLNLNSVKCIKVPLDHDFDLDTESLLEASLDAEMIFLCSPNNPTGNLLSKDRIYEILDRFSGIVVVDEAYIDFSGDAGFAHEIANYNNLIVLQTFSKYWQLAGLRMGICFSCREISEVLQRIKLPYNTNALSAQKALEKLQDLKQVKKDAEYLIKERMRVENALKNKKEVLKVFKSDANFILFEAKNANEIYERLCSKGVVIRKVSKTLLRVSIGLESENNAFLEVIF
ncbi:MAG: histidinol-phosphate transaminase [Candidatus Gracilibacteria bacterium]|jgi:histidinol-phosphate aminotransferase|nr:histidinol-phosphate transaminase [Candidatus Gracilibacteria bacterium]